MAIKLTKQQQQYLAVGAVMVAAFGFVYFKFFWMPLAKKIGEAQAKIATVTGEIEKATRQAARLPKLEADLISLNEQAIAAERRLPKTKSVPDILVTLSGLGQKNHVMILSVTPGGSASKQYFFEISYPISARGSFHNIGKFLAALSLEERIFNVMNVNYSEPAQDTGEMTISFTLISYQYKG